MEKNSINKNNLLNFTKLFELKYKEYNLTKNNISYKAKIAKGQNNILIKINNYSSSFNIKYFIKLTNQAFISIDYLYENLLCSFESNKAYIENIIINKSINLIVEMSNKKVDLFLLYKKDEEVKNCINDPEMIKYYIDLASDSFAFVDLDNSFCVFNSINNILYLVYTSKNNSIIFYDLNNFKKINEIKSFQKDFITSYRHISDIKNKRDLVMSISRDINDIKIWNINNLECILNIKNVNKNGNLLSACFLNKNNIYYIISSNCNYLEDSECIKIYDFNGDLKDEINNSNEKTLFVDIYYDEESSTIYIISCNFNFVKSYDYNKNELYHKYYDNDNEGHLGCIISKNEGIIRLIESCIDYNIRIWDFHKGFLLKKINTNNYLNGICLWDANYSLVGCENTTIKLIDLKKGLIVKNFTGHEKQVITIKKINHNVYGHCLVTQGFGNDKIKLLINEKIFL